MKKGAIDEFFMDIAELVYIIVMLYIFLGKQIPGLLTATNYYSAKYNAQALGGIISSFSTQTIDNATVNYILPKGKCDVAITSDHVDFKTYSQEIKSGDRTLRVSEQQAAYEFIKTSGINVESFSTSCSDESPQIIALQKIGSTIKVESL